MSHLDWDKPKKKVGHLQWNGGSNRKWIEKISGAHIILSYISFIIKCEWELVSGIWGVGMD